jgi:DNA-binding NarL/FixJ family response regulator
MDLTASIASIRHNAVACSELLAQQRLVVCFGQRATLCFFLAGPLGCDQIAGAFTTAAEARDCIAQTNPGFLLCSDQLEQGCGLELATAVKRQWPQIRTLILVSATARQDRLKAAIDAGCDGLLLDSSVGQGGATSALFTICHGGIVVDKQIAVRLRREQSSSHRHLQTLSPRELEVLAALTRGDNNAAIAARLMIAIDTVKSHIKTVLLKLGARGRTHAVVLALQQGLVDWPEAEQDR